MVDINSCPVTIYSGTSCTYLFVPTRRTWPWKATRRSRIVRHLSRFSTAVTLSRSFSTGRPLHAVRVIIAVVGTVAHSRIGRWLLPVDLGRWWVTFHHSFRANWLAKWHERALKRSKCCWCKSEWNFCWRISAGRYFRTDISKCL